MNTLQKRILEIKFQQKENHIGSCLSALPIIESIYRKMRPEDRFVLSSGHAGVALYAVLEAKGYIPKEKTAKLSTHPIRNTKYKIHASTGSLGHGIGIAVGMAISGRTTYCLLSDGEMAEGSVWEALTIADALKLKNLHIYINANGYGGMGKIDVEKLKQKIHCFDLNILVVHGQSNFGPFKGLDAHYKSLSPEQYEALIH